MPILLGLDFYHLYYDLPSIILYIRYNIIYIFYKMGLDFYDLIVNSFIFNHLQGNK